MTPLPYLSEEWRAEAERRLKAELTPEQLNRTNASMSNVHLDCPGGGTKYVLFRFKDGALTTLAIGPGEPPEAEFHLTGSYEVMVKILRAELGAKKALMSGQIKLKGNMFKAMQLASVAEKVDKILSGIPTEY
ncbi:MAG: SCP2 sterol-binding domain-containing protein [Candidatus Aminicenantes bacterium]|nr:SCP2 sterol-binding domain-containing protein [Candidatus Aminicenantes bacterium]